MIDVKALIGLPIFEISIETAYADVVPGDVVLFGGYSVHHPDVVDADTVVKVDADGIYFDGPSYIDVHRGDGVLIAKPEVVASVG